MVNITYPYVMIKLVGGFNPSEKYEFVSWDYYSQHMESHKIPWGSTPPTSYDSSYSHCCWFIAYENHYWPSLLTINHHY